ncbi:helix-turn-helix transcriptional regulator [Sulfitobacter sp. F26204]|uniref:helix-turn-helix domain-containing protein n=1 Tax=Sulfitobacter sp. F26204 TaxID=2996014 RepID=UPI00225E4940|nr:helix-turn-helix transcriptional regulator [Sulfitobacter sp. F26204]MCX7559977.1 helix-turn-helix transcriptional regulator [Sulfitobacter sp. F26204]
MTLTKQSPAELRNMFGANLRQLSEAYPSISDLSRQLGINRTQYNRYLSGESFPRPDVLARICAFFKVDARVLLEPVDQIGSGQDPISNPFLHDFLPESSSKIPNDLFPSGFYRFSRRSFTNKDVFIVGLVFVKRVGTNTYMRGYESINAMRVQNLPTNARAREFRGIAMQQEDGISLLVSRRNAMTSSFNFLNRVASFENNYWVGYITRTIPEDAKGLRATRMVYEYLGPKPVDALPAARKTGFHTVEELLPYHRRLLQTDMTFA